MTSAQKIIKYFDIGFAVALIVTIISCGITLIYNVGEMLGIIKSENVGDLTQLDEIGEFAKLEISLGATNLQIKNGDSFKAECNSERISVSCKNGKLSIQEETSLFGKDSVDRYLILYIPEGVTLEYAEIDMGAGNVKIERLSAERLYLDLGAGNFEAEYLEVTKKADIDGGIGNITVSDGAIHALDLDLGVGDTELKLDLTGESDIDTGMGELKIVLKRDKTEYTATVDKGIGTVSYDGVSVSDGAELGNGENTLDIDGGIGNINVSFNK